MESCTLVKMIRFNNEEWEIVCRKAAEAGMKNSTYLRWIDVHGEIKKFDNRQVNNMLLSFNSMGRLVNQIAKVANSSGSIYKSDVESLQEQFRRLSAVMKNYLSQFYPDDIL